MFKSVGKMDILHFVLSLIHCRFIGLNSPNGNSDNFFAMRYQWQQNKTGGLRETDWSLQFRASMWLQKVRNCYDDKRRRDQKLMRLWRGFGTFLCQGASSSRETAQWLRGSMCLGIKRPGFKPWLLQFLVLCICINYFSTR